MRLPMWPLRELNGLLPPFQNCEGDAFSGE
jgi:hypothetical protein